jgi:hypothetical protein
MRSMPLSANASAVAAPIPEDAPVINAILFMFFDILFLPQCCSEYFFDSLCVFEFHEVFRYARLFITQCSSECFFDSPCVFEFHGVFALLVLFLLFLIVKNYVHYVPMCFKAIRTTLLHQFPVGLGFVWI